ncbi:MAG: rod-binding protein [Gemmatimonadaceae bacterium]
MSTLPAVSSVATAGTPTTSDDTRLKKTATQMEGLFVQRLFAAMRDTVPDDGIAAQSSAESTFTSMLDEKMAEKVPAQWSGEHSLAQALYNQLRQRLSPATHTAAPAATTAAPSTDGSR